MATGALGYLAILLTPQDFWHGRYTGYWALLAIVGACLVASAVGLVYDAIGAVRRRGCNPAELRLSAHRMAADLHRYLNEREATNPTNQPPNLPLGGTDEQYHAVMAQFQASYMAHHTQTMNGFFTQFQSRALDLYDELHRCGVVRGRRPWIEHPVNSVRLRNIALLFDHVAAGETIKGDWHPLAELAARLRRSEDATP